MRLPRLFRRRRDLTCARFVEVVTDYLDGAMASGERARVDAHLRRCDGCTRYLEQIRTTIALTGRLTEADVHALDDGVREALMRAFRAAQRP